MHGWWPGSYSMYGWLGLVLNVFLILGVLIGIILLIIWLVRTTSSNQNRFGNGSAQIDKPLSAREILKIRYVRGEIDREKYQEMLEDIS
jgi:putative membrane protein